MIGSSQLCLSRKCCQTALLPHLQIIGETFMSLRIFPVATFIYMPGELGLGYFNHTQSSFKCMHFCLNNCFSLYLGGMDTQETTKPALVFDGALNFENSSYCLYCQ